MKKLIIQTIAIYVVIIIVNSMFNMHIPQEIAMLLGVIMLLQDKSILKDAKDLFSDVKEGILPEKKETK